MTRVRVISSRDCVLNLILNLGSPAIPPASARTWPGNTLIESRHWRFTQIMSHPPGGSPPPTVCLAYLSFDQEASDVLGDPPEANDTLQEADGEGNL